MQNLPEYVVNRCQKSGDCMLWTGPLAAHGNPRMSFDGERVLVRRHLSEKWFDDVRAEKLLSPNCGDSRCLSPQHLVVRDVRRMEPFRRSKEKKKSAEYGRNSNLWRIYRISLVEWNGLFERQGKRCALCGSTEPRGKNWHTDHCHETKKIRGILCGWCNTGIGKLQESSDLFLRAIAYLGNGKQDLEKARHYIDLLIEAEYPE